MSSTPGTDLVPWARPEPGALGVTGVLRRVSDLALGAAGLSLRASVEAVERFVPAEPDEGAARASGPLGEILRLIPGAALGVGFALQRSALEVSAAVEGTVARVATVLGRPRLLQAPLGAAEGYLETWHDRGLAEQARNQALLAEFARRLAPAVAEALVTRLDVSAVVERLPLDDLVAQVDLDALLASVDVGALVDRIEVDALLDRVNVDAFLDRVNVDALLDRVNVDALLERVDVEALVARVDVDTLVERVDLDALLDEIDIGGLIRESTGSVTSDVVDGARVSAMRLDRFVARVTDRILLRRTPRRVDVLPFPMGDSPP